MRITGVAVRKLFGIFNHDVRFNTEERITIIHGPNGFGKTILLKTIQALFSRNYYELLRIPFSEFSVSFDDGSTLRVRTRLSPPQEEKIAGQFNMELIRSDGETRAFDLTLPKHDEVHFPIEIVSDTVPELQRVGPQHWIHVPTQEQLSIEQVFDRFGDRLPVRRATSRRPKEEPWYTQLLKSVQVHFIVTQRLLKFPVRRRREYELAQSMVPTVAAYSEELAASIQEKAAEYGVLSQSLDRTFPTRLMMEGTAPDLSVEEIRQKLEALEKRRLRLMQAGVLDKEREIDFGILPNKITDANKNVLLVYVQDTTKKLEVFEAITNKIDLLMSMVNNRFLYKTMSVTRRGGFVFTSSVGSSLAPALLSSGEQHEIVLLYELLFKVAPGSLILIDEPELSLHVVWQQQFLSDLQQITRVGQFDALIATHSPQIIHDRWDLTVQLEGPPDAEAADRS